MKEEKDIVKEQREKWEKDIAEGLSQLKKSSSEDKKEEVKEEKASVNGRIEHLKSSLAGESVDKDLDIEKRIETGKKFKDKDFIKWVEKKIKREKTVKEKEESIKKEGVVISSDLHDTGLFYDEKKIEAARRTIKEKNKGWFGSLFSKKESVPKMTNRDISSFSGGVHDTESRKIAKSFMGNISEKSIARKEASNMQKDSSIFGGKSEISRLKLKHELRYNPKVWQAQRQAGLTLSPAERVKLEKEVFSQALGGNISKTDIKWGVKKLNQKMLGAKNITEEGKIRKQIEFIKKIGGIR